MSLSLSSELPSSEVDSSLEAELQQLDASREAQSKLFQAEKDRLLNSIEEEKNQKTKTETETPAEKAVRRKRARLLLDKLKELQERNRLAVQEFGRRRGELWGRILALGGGGGKKRNGGGGGEEGKWKNLKFFHKKQAEKVEQVEIALAAKPKGEANAKAKAKVLAKTRKNLPVPASIKATMAEFQKDVRRNYNYIDEKNRDRKQEPKPKPKPKPMLEMVTSHTHDDDDDDDDDDSSEPNSPSGKMNLEDSAISSPYEMRQALSQSQSQSQIQSQSKSQSQTAYVPSPTKPKFTQNWYQTSMADLEREAQEKKRVQWEYLKTHHSPEPSPGRGTGAVRFEEEENPTPSPSPSKRPNCAKLTNARLQLDRLMAPLLSASTPTSPSGRGRLGLSPSLVSLLPPPMVRTNRLPPRPDRS